MNTAELLSLVIKHNREIMDEARKAIDAAGETTSREWQEAYQIYRDASDAFDTARRWARYGIPGVE